MFISWQLLLHSPSTTMPFSIHNYAIHHPLQHTPCTTTPFSINYYAILHPQLRYSPSTTTPYFIHYYTIIHPLKSRYMLTMSQTRRIFLFTWIISFVDHILRCSCSCTI